MLFKAFDNNFKQTPAVQPNFAQIQRTLTIPQSFQRTFVIFSFGEMCIKWWNNTFHSQQWRSYGLDFTQRSNVELKYADRGICDTFRGWEIRAFLQL